MLEKMAMMKVGAYIVSIDRKGEQVKQYFFSSWQCVPVC